MPIQRQSDAYKAFDDGVRYAKDYETRDLPEGLVNALSRGVGITAGLNDPRRMKREADAYAVPTDGYGAGPRSGDFGRDGGPAVPTSYHAEDDQSALTGYSPDELQYQEHGLDPHQHIPEEQVTEAPPAHSDVAGFGWGGYDDFDPHSAENLPPDAHEQFDPHMASFTEARSHTAEDGPAPGPGLFNPMMFQPGERLDARSLALGGPVGEQWVTAAAMQPQVVPGWVGHGYVPGHRVSLPIPQGNFQGTVTHLDGQQVGIRWDDGQHSSEEPKDLRPL